MGKRKTGEQWNEAYKLGWLDHPNLGRMVAADGQSVQALRAATAAHKAWAITLRNMETPWIKEAKQHEKRAILLTKLMNLIKDKQ